MIPRRVELTLNYCVTRYLKISWLKIIWINCLTDSIGQELGHSLAEWIWLRVSHKPAITALAGVEVISKLDSKKHPLFPAYLVLGRIQFLKDYWVRPSVHHGMNWSSHGMIMGDQRPPHWAAQSMASGFPCNKLAREWERISNRSHSFLSTKTESDIPSLLLFIRWWSLGVAHIS